MILFLNRKNKQRKAQQNIQAKKEATGWNWALLLKIAVIGVLVFLLWRGWDYTKPSNFPVKQVQITSSYEHVDKKLLQNIVASYVNNGFFYLNAIGMKRQLLKLPWVYAISVQRKWPDTIAINVVEQHAVLQWGAKALINDKGEIFESPVATFPKGLSMVFGPEERGFEIFTLYKKAQKVFEPLELSIKQLYFKSQGYWEVLLDNNAMVYLKENEPLVQLELLGGLYPRITAGHNDPPKSIDLRYNTDGLAVKW
ncbi:MAG: cell division protein FtsQ [uncultured bacterium]|nr:MAG: cell division protein FtsQ [uncultured bacterium]